MKRFTVVVVFVVLFCVTAGAQDWKQISSAKDLEGSWEGFETLQIPQNVETGIPKSSLKVTISLQCLSGKNVTLTVNMDLNQLLKDWLAMPEFKDAGVSKDDIWEYFIDQMSSMLEAEFNDDYTISYPISAPVEEFMDGSTLVTEINRGKTKLKLTFPDLISLGIGDQGFKEIVLDKKRQSR
jgi:hypothetical protein